MPPARTTCRCASTSSARLTLTTPLRADRRRTPATRTPSCWRSARRCSYRVTLCRRRRVDGADHRPRRDASRPVPVPAGRRRRQRAAPCSCRARAYDELRDRRAHRRGAGRSSSAPRRQQVEQALDEQQTLRTQKLGDILLTRRSSRPSSCWTAIEQQARMPMVRIGEALLALGFITDAQLEDGAGAAARATAACRWANCWCAWAWSRATTCRRRWRARWAIRWSTSTPSRSRPRRCASCRYAVAARAAACCRCCCATAAWSWRWTTRRAAATRSRRSSSSRR